MKEDSDNKQKIKKVKVFPFMSDFRTGQGVDFDFLLDDKEGLPPDLDDSPRIYIIETVNRFKFPYPKGQSEVIYIGMSDKLRTRILEHRRIFRHLKKSKGQYGMKKNEPWVSSKYQYMYKHGARVYIYKCRRTQDAKNEESSALWSFYMTYRALPVGNGAKSYMRARDRKQTQ